ERGLVSPAFEGEETTRLADNFHERVDQATRFLGRQFREGYEQSTEFIRLVFLRYDLGDHEIAALPCRHCGRSSKNGSCYASCSSGAHECTAVHVRHDVSLPRLSRCWRFSRFWVTSRAGRRRPSFNRPSMTVMKDAISLYTILS